MSFASRAGPLSPYLQSTSFAVTGPLKALVPGVVLKSDKVLLDPKRPFLCRESLSGQSPRTGPSVSASLNGESGAVSESQIYLYSLHSVTTSGSVV